MQDETARYVAQDNNKQAGRREIEKRRGAFNNNNVLYTIAIGGLSSRFFFCRIDLTNVKTLSVVRAGSGGHGKLFSSHELLFICYECDFFLP